MTNDDISGGFDSNDNLDFYKSLLDDMVTFVAVLDNTGTILFVNNTPLNVAGITLEEIKRTKFWDAAWWSYSEEAIKTIKEDVGRCASGETLIHEIQLATKDGTLIWIEYSMHPIFDKDGDIKYLVPEGRDVTVRKQQEELLRHSLKMDALGKLSAGIAHDYNNILGIISGYSELIGEEVAFDPKLKKYISDIQNATARGSKLTQKLLAFTKQKDSVVSICDINHILIELQLMIEKTLTSKVNLLYKLEDNLWPVELDINDLEDCIINICINSMHAMSSGGQLSIHTNNVLLNEYDAAELNLASGAHITLSIADIGCGMDESTVARIFDPFFTTKGDIGTGLGMSQVYGFIKRSGGTIKIFSEVGLGTRSVLYFPRSNKQITPSYDDQQKNLTLDGNETLLVVDDEIALGELAYEILKNHGYKVLIANSAVQALKVLEKTDIDLVISDIIMPNMDGYELASLIQQQYPSTKIQLVSGFEHDSLFKIEHSTLRQNIIFKPYTSKNLLIKVRDLLD